MNRQSIYRGLLRLLPAPRLRLCAVGQPPRLAKLSAFEAILRRHRALGGALAMFDGNGLTHHLVYGQARRGSPVAADTVFRLASVSKLVTAAGVVAMAQAGLLDLDADVDPGLPYSLRHPKAPDLPITLRMLLTHTAGIRDGADYFAGLESGAGAGQVLAGDSHTAHLPGAGCEYTNFGFGLIACVVEAQTGLSFETAMQRHLFEPLGMAASYYPQRVRGPLADARRVLPPRLKPNYDARARQAQPDTGWDSPDAQRHHLLAQGSCCMAVPDLVRLGQVLLRPGFFSPSDLQLLRGPWADLSHRDPHLRLGLGQFVLRDPRLGPVTLHGHQGMAYGAVHLLFMDVDSGQGLLSLTTGVSEARQHIMADVNRDLLFAWLAHG